MKEKYIICGSMEDKKYYIPLAVFYKYSLALEYLHEIQPKFYGQTFIIVKEQS